jgi:hypothetical protein
MAKRRRGRARSGARIEQFGEDLGRLLGTAQARAKHWLGQRQEIVKHLSDIRDTASRLLADLGSGHRGRGGRRARVQESAGLMPQLRRKRRRLSAAARKAISDAQKRRWAAVRAKEK